MKIEVYYSKGGMNYFTGRNERRWLYMSVCPVQREFKSGYTSESYTAFSGTKQLLMEMGRFNLKKCQEYVVREDTKKQLIDHVLRSNWLKLKSVE